MPIILVLFVALFLTFSQESSAAWGDSPDCVERVGATRDATREFYEYYGREDAVRAEALVRLSQVRRTLGPSRAACRGEHEQIFLAFHERELVLIESDIRTGDRSEIFDLAPVAQSR